jgi:hypothetical protein
VPVYKPVDRAKMISDYMDAFRKANPDRKVPIIAYRRGHYRFKTNPEAPWEIRGYRHRDMQRMLQTLRAAVGDK